MPKLDLQTGAITYAGTFNGTFKTDKEWTTDPAWILYDVLTETRAGCGIAESNLDKFSFKTVSEYCGESVDAGNGDGSTEPRFSCNVNITQRQVEAYTLINSSLFCYACNAFLFCWWNCNISRCTKNGIQVTFLQMQMLLKVGFVYTGSSLKTRHTVINVSYFDMVLKKSMLKLLRLMPATQAKYGIVVKNIKAFATTSVIRLED